MSLLSLQLTVVIDPRRGADHLHICVHPMSPIETPSLTAFKSAKFAQLKLQRDRYWRMSSPLPALSLYTNLAPA